MEFAANTTRNFAKLWRLLLIVVVVVVLMTTAKLKFQSSNISIKWLKLGTPLLGGCVCLKFTFNYIFQVEFEFKHTHSWALFWAYPAGRPAFGLVKPSHLITTGPGTLNWNSYANAISNRGVGLRTLQDN